MAWNKNEWLLIPLLMFMALAAGGCLKKSNDLYTAQPEEITYSDGTLDNTFGNGGIVITDLGAADSVKAISILKNGMILVAGTSGDNFALARYNTDGSLDNTFGDINGDARTGKVTNAIGNGNIVEVKAIEIYYRKIVVVGALYNGSTHEFFLTRYNGDGSLDTIFGSNGIVTIDIGPGDDWAYTVAIQPDGKIVAAGSTSGGFAILRIKADGNLDNTFGIGGKVVTELGEDWAGVCRKVFIQADGKILATGDSGGDFALARYNTDGSLDNSFGVSGIVKIRKGSSTIGGIYIGGIAAQSDGKIVIDGQSGGYHIAVERFNSDGSVDTSFGSDGTGIVSTHVGLDDDYCTAIALQGDGKIIVAGYSVMEFEHYYRDFAVVRYNVDGTLDTTFDNGTGKVLTAVDPGHDGANVVALQPDGKIVAAGFTGYGEGDFALVRYK